MASIIMMTKSLRSSSTTCPQQQQHCIICCQQLINNFPQQHQHHDQYNSSIDQNKKLFKSICHEFNLNPSSLIPDALDLNAKVCTFFCPHCKETAISIMNLQNRIKDLQVELQRLVDAIEQRVQSSSQEQNDDGVFCGNNSFRPLSDTKDKEMEKQIKYFRNVILRKDPKKKKCTPIVLVEKVRRDEHNTLSSSLSKTPKPQKKKLKLKRGESNDSKKSTSYIKKTKRDEEIVVKEEVEEYQENQDQESDEYNHEVHVPSSSCGSNSNAEDQEDYSSTFDNTTTQVISGENDTGSFPEQNFQNSLESEMEFDDQDPDWSHNEDELSEEEEEEEEDHEDPLQLNCSKQTKKSKSKSKKTQSINVVPKKTHDWRKNTTKTKPKRERPPKVRQRNYYGERPFFKPHPNDPHKLVHKGEFEVTIILQEGQGQGSQGRSDGEDLKRKFQCSTCQFSVGTKVSMMNHIRLVHLGRGYKCDLCPKKYSRNDLLKCHINSVHQGQKIECPVCARPLKCSGSKNALVIHLWTHKNQTEKDEFIATTNRKSLLRIPHHALERDQICDVCGKSFTSRSIKSHKKSHTNKEGLERNCYCSTCGKSFLSEGALRTHERKHTEPTRYQCPICCKGFYNKCQLTNHVRVHTGERIHDCQSCGKKFSSRSLLRAHQVVHTMDKPFKCKSCDAAFAWKTQLGRHVKRCRNNATIAAAAGVGVETETESMATATTTIARAGLQIVEGWTWTQ